MTYEEHLCVAKIPAHAAGHLITVTGLGTDSQVLVSGSVMSRCPSVTTS